jgi:hypothetical protein
MGIGKSKIIADAISLITSLKQEELSQFEVPILITVNSTFLRDIELPAELKKWNCSVKVKIACYQSTYKWNKNIGLLISDEMDFAFAESEVYARTFTNNKYRYFLGMTGTLMAGKFQQSVEVFKSLPFYRYTIKQAQMEGVLNKTVVWLHHVPFTTAPTSTAPYGEVSKYKWINKKIEEATINMSKSWEIVKDVNNYSVTERQDAKAIADEWKEVKNHWESSPFNYNSRLRFLRSADSLINYAILLKNRILARNPDNKVIIFSELTDDIDKITVHRYHGKSKNLDVIKQFNEGTIRELGVVKKVNRGVNFNKLNNCIAQSFNSSTTNAQQAYIGRMVRLQPDELAHVHILVSYYISGRDKVFAKNWDWAQSFLNSEELNHIQVINYDKGLI